MRPWLRPHPARWFELLVAREDTLLALEALAATGAVELEARSGATLPPAFAELAPLLREYDALAQRYRGYWPSERLQPSPVPDASPAALQRGLERLRAWAVQAEPLIQRLQHAQAALEPARLWQRVFAQLARSPAAAARIAQAGPTFQTRLAVFLAEDSAELPAAPGGALAQGLDIDGTRALLVVGSVAALQAFEPVLRARQAQWLAPPDGAQAQALATAEGAQARFDALQTQAREAAAALDAQADAHGLRRVLADMQRLHWVLDNVRALETGPLFAWITGWTPAATPQTLDAAIEASGARALLRLAEAPLGTTPPLLLANPWWARPFELFARAMGMPSRNEADPSVLLALAVPLLFGYMFGDLGQGLVIAAAGFALRRRWPVARLFIAGGLSAALFGLLFGSVFSLHRLTPWWIAPLDDPLTVLLLPLAGGALLLTLGLLLSAAEAFWRGELRAWLATDAALMLCYLGLLAGLLWRPALALAAAAALAYCLGSAVLERQARAALAALGELAERLMQLLLNTLSFARVGAFALAHAGLSLAIASLMDAAQHPIAAAAVLLLGNALVIALEGLVVSIQTTRLVLFEFFTRFLQAQGRVFRPLPPPPSILAEVSP